MEPTASSMRFMSPDSRRPRLYKPPWVLIRHSLSTQKSSVGLKTLLTSKRVSQVRLFVVIFLYQNEAIEKTAAILTTVALREVLAGA